MFQEGFSVFASTACKPFHWDSLLELQELKSTQRGTILEHTALHDEFGGNVSWDLWLAKDNLM